MTTAHRFRLALVGVMVLAAVAAAAYWYAGDVRTQAASGSTPPATGSTPVASTSAAPAAPAGSSATAVPPAARADLPTDVPAPTPGQSIAADPTGAQGGGQVQVAVTYAEWDTTTHSVEVDGFVSGVVESGGTCLLTLTRGGESLTNQATGSASASTTSCGSVYLQDPRLSAGTWQAVLSYRSPTASGSSSPVSVRVPA